SRHEEGVAFSNLGSLRYERGLLEEAEGLYEEALAILRATGSPRELGIVLCQQASLAADRGDLVRAHALAEEARTCLEKEASPPLLPLLHVLRAHLELASSREARGAGEATRLLGAGLSEVELTGRGGPASEVRLALRLLRRAMGGPR